ncbi:MAG TPA: adenylate/guanylate cyclase domain-containing protein [Acidimicrobiales bacterium]|nr:adenylate/guanylate cyclase domain-containing protein [Acidimicrobiales bacterium]
MTITVFLADDSLLVREGVRAVMELAGDVHVVGVASEFHELVEGAWALQPQVVVTDIRMPPEFRREGIEAAKLVRKRHPGTGIVILSQYDDPEYAIALLSEGAAGYAYLLKDRVGEGDQLVRAIREVASGGSMLDPRIVEALTKPVTDDALLSATEQQLLDFIADGTPIKAIAVALRTTPADVDGRIESLFVHLADGLSAGNGAALERLRRLQRAIAQREEQGEVLSRLLPGGLAAKLRRDGRRIGETEELDVTVLMSDIRGYSGIAERTDPTTLAGQLNRHRAEMNEAIIDHGGTVMQFVGDAVMAVFGAPEPVANHADRAVEAATAMHEAQARVNGAWAQDGIEPFGLGIGVSTGRVAAALLGSEQRLEYSVVGDTVNLTQRLQQWAEPGETVLGDATVAALGRPIDADVLEPALVKGRSTPVRAHRFPRRSVS